MAEAQDSTSKQLYCPICLETFDSPKSLPCMHTFCEKCICKHASGLSEEGTQSTIISCPVCRSPIPAPATKQNPDDWAANLPNNSVVLSLSASNRADSDAPVYCEPCVTRGERHISVAFCVTCSEYLCSTCYNYHKTFKMSRDHQMTVHTVPERQILNSAQEAMYICQTHNEKLTYFCSEHRELCCMKCALKDHRKCKELLSTEDRVNDDRQDFKQVLENLDVLSKMFVLLIDNRTKTLETIQQQKSDIIRSIKDWSSFIKGQLDKLETTTIQELEQICKEGTIIISDQVVECKSAIAAIETSQRMLAESTNSDDRAKLFVTLTKVSQQLLKYLQKHDMVENRSKEIKIGFQRNKNLEEIIQTLGSLGQVSCETSRIRKVSHNVQFKGTFMTPSCVQLNSTVTVNAKILGDKKACNITSGVSLPDKRIVLYDDGNEKLKLFDKCFHFVSHLDLCTRSNICVVDERTVAVSGWWNIVFLVSVTDRLQRVRSIDVGKKCYEIASFEQSLIVCVDGNSILTYDASYKISKRIKSFDCGVYKAICVSPDGQRIHYIVQDKIVTMDMNGKKLDTFKSDELKGVVAITVDKNGIIYCCGQESNNVVLFSSEGRQLCVLLSGEHGLKNPIGICLNDKNNKLLVFQSESSEIKVFALV